MNPLKSNNIDLLQALKEDTRKKVEISDELPDL